ncbi:MAG: hypothetical protein IH626_22805 [Rhodospirillales bacterium]|nr:hypothetical protein [Rhodospirillales bacterium]
MTRVPNPRRKPDPKKLSLISLDVPVTPQSLVSLEPGRPAIGQNEDGGASNFLTVAESGEAKPDSTAAVESTPKQRSISAFPGQGDVLYVYPEGYRLRHQGGTRSWRNNNPGNMEYGETAKEYGAIGRDNEGFAIFPDETTGDRALRRLLKNGRRYRNATVQEAIAHYAPKETNDTAAYQSFMLRVVGVDDTTLMRDLTPEQFEKFVAGIRRFEGWKVGEVTRHGVED